MGRRIQWDIQACEDYCEWQNDKAALKRINTLIKAALRDPFGGTGKPELLKHDPSGMWSRRINDADRLTYEVQDDVIVILSCKGH